MRRKPRAWKSEDLPRPSSRKAGRLAFQALAGGVAKAVAFSMRLVCLVRICRRFWSRSRERKPADTRVLIRSFPLSLVPSDSLLGEETQHVHCGIQHSISGSASCFDYSRPGWISADASPRWARHDAGHKAFGCERAR